MKYPESAAKDKAQSPPRTGPASPEELLAVAVAVVRPAADLARQMRTDGVFGVSTKSTDTDVVTAADRAVERYVAGALSAARPGDTILGEEFGAATADGPEPAGRASDGGQRVRWILDPIDGTVNYLYDLPVCAVSLAAEVNGTVVAGVVRNIPTGGEWTATRGGGSYADGRRMTGSEQTVFGQALLATGFGYARERRADQARVLAGLLPQVRDIRRFGAAAVDLCLVAEGKIDAYYEQGLNLWDHAAGGLIAAEAGLLVTGLEGKPAGPDLVLAAPPVLYPPLHEALVALDAAGGAGR
ncbi:MAG: inositol monophosphatase [Dactylosporangium sp.]|nr:inositol monophosphatase [Dactylosporangium sp.]NNJ62138.1 inositol monophosphatase [Dactylosporangium sp.]